MPVAPYRSVLPVKTAKGWPQPVTWQPCPFCRKPAHPMAAEPGSHLGNSTTLCDNILGDAGVETHPWYTGPSTLAAHHLICSEAMERSEDWARACWYFGYDINRPQNGVFLPMVPAVACELHVPLHVGNHRAGLGSDPDSRYPAAVKQLLEAYVRGVADGKYCPNPVDLTDDLDEVSDDILGFIASGDWTLTSDGRDYLPGGVGCSGVTSIRNKDRVPCPEKRRHGHRHPTTKKLLPRRVLRVGS